jgi:hypothetical protein
MRDARVKTVDCGAGEGVSSMFGVKDAMRAASRKRECRAGRCNPFERCALVRNECFSDPQGDDDAR